MISNAYGPVVAMGVDAATFVVSALGILLIRLRPAAAPDDRGGLLEGAKFLQHDDAIGLVLACVAVGTILGAPLVAHIRKALGFGPTWMTATALSGLAMACIGPVTGVPAIVALMALLVFGTAVAGICSQSFRQEVTPSHLLGRVTAAFWTTHYALSPVGAALLTLGASHLGVPTVPVIAGFGCVAVSLSGLLTPIRRPFRPAETSGSLPTAWAVRAFYLLLGRMVLVIWNGLPPNGTPKPRIVVTGVDGVLLGRDDSS